MVGENQKIIFINASEQLSQVYIIELYDHGVQRLCKGAATEEKEGDKDLSIPSKQRRQMLKSRHTSSLDQNEARYTISTYNHN